MIEVVVTAINIKRDKGSMGYPLTQVNSNEVNVARQSNVMNSFVGKVSGLQISRRNTGFDNSNKILLLGATTITGLNRPLVVVSGIPITGNGGGNGQVDGADRGNILSDSNPNDIASISVLKGAGATALYGFLGIHEVILITT